MAKGKGSDDCKENIKVLVRIRPLLERERSTQVVTQVNDDETAVNIETETHNVHAQFDHVFSPSSSQSQVYEHVKFAADSVVKGFNSTIFAYGQTGSGKSFTMFGPEDDLSIYAGGTTSDAMGVIPRAIRGILAKVDAIRAKSKQGDPEDEEEVAVYCSFLQIYNDQPYDLLRDPYRVRPLQVHENTRTREVYVVGLSEYAVNNVGDCLALLEQGDEQRACRQTSMNDVSSRSHSIFQMVVERRKVHTGRVIRSKLNLVDLAGSEKWGTNDQLEKGHISEMTNINTSLHTLGRCIAALTDPEATHVPFRDSKLTRILMDALGGNSRTCVIATLSPSEAYIDESISTLKFADRAKRVMQHARVMETREVSLELVERLEREINFLRGVLANAGVDPALWGGTATEEKGQSEESQAGEEEGYGEYIGKESGALQRKLFEAQEKIRRLERENSSLRASQRGEQGVSSVDPSTLSSSSTIPSASSNHAVPTQSALAVAAEAEAENKKLKNLLTNVKAAARKFFRFEIEEEEFQELFEKHMALASTFLKGPSFSSVGTSSLTSAIPTSTTGAKKSNGRELNGPVFRGAATSSAPSPVVVNRGDTVESVRAKAMYRVRGKGDHEATEWKAGSNTAESTAKTLAANLKEKQKELAKHKRLQQYLAEKAQRELERLEAEKGREEQVATHKKQRDKNFQKHASLVKRKLLELRETEKRIIQEESRLQQGYPSENQNDEDNRLPKL